MASAESLTIVVPVLNEAESIEKFCNDANSLQIQAREMNLNVDFIFVDNGSMDSSHELLEEKCKVNTNFVLSFCESRGYGAALKSGFRLAKGDFIGFIDLDSTYPLLDFLSLTQRLLSDKNMKMCIGSRMNSRSKMPWVRKVGNTLYKLAIQYIYFIKIPDACSGMRVFRKEHLHFVLSQSNDGLGFSIQLTCATLRAKWSLGFHPIAYLERSGPSKLKVFRDGFDFLKEIFRERFKVHRAI